MQNVTNHNATSAAQFPPLEQETRSHIPTPPAAFFLSRKDQTLMSWVSKENGSIRAIRIHGRLLWSVADIKRLLNGGAK
jgi:hypothetical protein